MINKLIYKNMILHINPELKTKLDALKLKKAVKDYEVDCLIKGEHIDPFIKKIKPEATIGGLIDTLNSGADVYDYIGVSDSIIREKAFEVLEKHTGEDYNVFYYLWLYK